ncbi:MAG: hypothetical protein ACJ76P_12785 [Actinomycetota bacterium]
MAFLGTPAAFTRVLRRRWLVAGAVGGIALGSAVGALAVAAPSDAARVPRLVVLHAAPAFADPGSELELSAGTVCDRPASRACTVTSAAAEVRTPGDRTWAHIDGNDLGGSYRFRIPAVRGAFDYRLSFRTADGQTTTYPPSGAPIHVASAAGLPASSPRSAFSWNDVREPERRALYLPYGDGPGEVGLDGGGPDSDLTGPSSFAVAPDGSISVADWVNDRVETFHDGVLQATFRTPVHRTFDLAVGSNDHSYLLTLGTDGAAYEVADGRVIGRYPVAFGVASRVTTTSMGPAVNVAPEQWVSVRSSAGVARSTEVQAESTTAAPAAADGSSTRFGLLSGGRVPLRWTRNDGTTGGTELTLPDGARAGTEYFAEPLPDGGAVLALGLWDEHHNGVGLFRFDRRGAVRSFSLLPEPSTRADARASTVRWSRGRVLEAIDHPNGMSIERYDLGGGR